MVLWWIYFLSMMHPVSCVKTAEMGSSPSAAFSRMKYGSMEDGNVKWMNGWKTVHLSKVSSDTLHKAVCFSLIFQAHTKPEKFWISLVLHHSCNANMAKERENGWREKRKEIWWRSFWGDWSSGSWLVVFQSKEYLFDPVLVLLQCFKFFWIKS